MNIDQSQCPSCESKNTSVRIQSDEIPYREHKGNMFKHGVSVVKIPVTVPVRTCADCDLEWTDHHGEKRREEAVAKYRASKSLSL
jgi:C4-type Zn-finger protein